MKLDTNSKHGVLIGWMHLIAYTFFAINPVLRAIRFANMDEYDDIPPMTYDYLLEALGFLFMATLSGLLIFGVVKKRHLFMAPWLICTTLGVIIFAGVMFIRCFAEFDYIFYVIEHIFLMIGMQILVIYPTYHLYLNIREFSKKQVYTPNKEYSNNIKQISYVPFDNPEKNGNSEIITQKVEV